MFVNTRQITLLTCLHELPVDISVYGEVTQWGLVEGTLADSTARQPDMVAGSQDENCPDSGGVNLAEAVCSSCARVAVTSMGADDCPGRAGDLGGVGQPGGQLLVQLLAIAGIPGVGMAGSSGGHQVAGVALILG